MKKRILHIILVSISIFLFANKLNAQNVSLSGTQTVCPGNSAIITVSCTVPNSIVTIVNDNNYAYNIIIGASGTSLFTTPLLNTNTTYTVKQVKVIATNAITLINGVSILIQVIPNGCATITTSDGSNLATPSPICNVGDCRTLSAVPKQISSTSSYLVESIPYCPSASYDNPSWTQLYPTQINGDDQWSPPFTLPFDFCFFGNSYNKINVGTNGVIAFPNPTPIGGGTSCPWSFSTSVPSAALIRNAIFGVYQDSNYAIVPTPPAILSTNYSVIGTYPCRKFIVNFSNLPQYQCNNSVGLQTSQIVFYEVSNIIEVFVHNRTACTTWNNGNGIIGIQNATGTQGYTPPGRNTGNWTATDEAWRFTPNGAPIPMTFQWLENGNPISTDLTTTVCPTATTTYVAQATYNVCGLPVIATKQVTLTVYNDPTQNPNNLDICFDSSQIYTTDLTQNNSVILGNLSPNNFIIKYYQTLTDAELRINNLAAPTNYTYSGTNTIYVGILNLTTNCYYIKTFDINILAPVLPPTGITPQNFIPGQTLADLVVNGTNIVWFDAPTGGNILPPTTLLQDNTTYYAAELNANGCFSRNTNSTRLAITTLNSLSNSIFDTKNLLIYPNPTSGNFRITSDILIDSIEIFDVIGKKIDSIKFNEKNVSVNLSSYNSGVYFIKIYAEGSSKIYKIVKE